MLISELIEALQEQQNIYGDQDVLVRSRNHIDADYEITSLWEFEKDIYIQIDYRS